ncbi:1348_t:CDS:2 [Ambispora gerdemannii]|uniref:1348_t:CDS:1 n=1 Tax=Ambispora gerdemannii TaxID=144530 RepID=A0A9N9FCS4_9GLOM|nr:1348_t:CDS:2 [Ambispora gerdemannii]
MTDGYSSSATNTTSISRIRQPTRLSREFERQKQQPQQILKLLYQNQKPPQVQKNFLVSSSASSYEDDEDEENVDSFIVQPQLENINRSSIRRTTISHYTGGINNNGGSNAVGGQPPSFIPSRRLQYVRNTDDEEVTSSMTQQRKRRTTISAAATTTTNTATTATATIGTKKCETDDELFKPNHRHSLPAPPLHTPSTQNNSMEDTTSTTTTKSLLYLLNKEREKRCTLQKTYDSTVQAYHDLQKTHTEDLSALESDIQTLQDALRKESKTSLQLNQLLRDAHAKFVEEMQKWAGKVMEMETQGKELQTTFSDTMERLEKEETEILRLRAENQQLKEQLAAGGNNSNSVTTNISRRNLEDVTKVGSLEDGDDISISAESRKQTPSLHENFDDIESISNYSKINELNERVAELENELSNAKENQQKLLVNIRALENENQTIVKQMEEKHENENQTIVKQMEEKHEKQVRLLRASLAQKQKQIDDLEKDLRMEKYSQNQKRKSQQQIIQSPPQRPLSPPHQQQQQIVSESNIDDRRLQLLLLNKNHRRPSVHSLHERKSSLTSTNSGSNESVSQEGGSVEENKDSVRIRVTRADHFEEVFSDEEEEQTSSVCTGSENCVQSRTSEEILDSSIPDEFANANPSSSANSRQNVGLNTNCGIGTGGGNNNSGGGDAKAKQDNVLDDDELDAILSDREDRALPLIGHYSAAEFTEDEDYTMMNSLEQVLGSRRHSMVNGRLGMKLAGNSLARTLKKLNAGKRGWASGGEDIL